uniref:Gustatory receptor n=1 Tax=Anopheles albimanus TaxID=7167 RepID=A0A1Y9G8C8_ANOAL
MANIFHSIRILFWCLHAIGQLSIEHGIVRGVSSFRVSHHAGRKFVILFPITLAVCGYLMYDCMYNYDILDEMGMKILWMSVYVVYELTLIGMFLVLTWQTHWKRKCLAALLNILVENEQELYTISGRTTSYRNVNILATIVLVNGVIAHIVFHFYYITTYEKEKRFLAIHFVNCCFLYIDLAMEYLLGFCSCLMLILQNQLSQLIKLILQSDASLDERCYQRLWHLYCRFYYQFVHDIYENLTVYFGPIIAPFCAYVCLEVAAIVLDASQYEQSTNLMEITVNIMWSLGDLKKLIVLFVEETARCTRYFDDYRLQNTRAAKQVQKFLLKNLHQKKKFSACGFFDIDNTVIYMVFSSIVTYLVILIQFKQLENDLTQPVPYNGTANGTTEAP